MIQIAVLCVDSTRSAYRLIEGLELFTKEKDAYTFSGSHPVITHAPCPTWSRLKHFAKYDKLQHELAYFCWEKMLQNGGIFEHPYGSSFFKTVSADMSKLITIDQSMFGHQMRKRTWLYFHNIQALPIPCRSKPLNKKHDHVSKFHREETPLRFAKYLVNCIRWNKTVTVESTIDTDLYDNCLL